MGLLGKLWTVLKYGGKIPFKPIIILFKMLKSSSLILVFLFFVMVVPSIMGTYSYLQYHDVPWYFAVFSSIGIEFGGPIFTILNSLEAYHYAAGPVEKILVLLGIPSAILGAAWFFFGWHRINRFVEGRDLSPMWVHGLGIVFLSMAVVIALMTDQYMLPEESLRVSGLTYFFNSPRAALEPLLNLAGTSFEPAELLNQSTVINQTVQNSSVGA